MPHILADSCVDLSLQYKFTEDKKMAEDLKNSNQNEE